MPCKASKLGLCSHVLAVLLYIVDYIDKKGIVFHHRAQAKNVRGIREKRLSDTNYPTKRKTSSINVIDFDPRPKKYRRVSKTSMTL